MPKQTSTHDRSKISADIYSKQRDCLFAVWDILSGATTDLETLFRELLHILPSGMQYSDSCVARIVFDGHAYTSPDFSTTPWVYSAEIMIEDEARGVLEVYYTESIKSSASDPFLPEEKQLVHTIAQRLGQSVDFQNLKRGEQESPFRTQIVPYSGSEDWRAMLNMYAATNLGLLLQLANKMAIHLGLRNVAEADRIIQQRSLRWPRHRAESSDEEAEDSSAQRMDVLSFGSEIFHLAAQYLPVDEITSCLHHWISEDRCNSSVRIIADPDSTLRETIDAIRFLERCETQGVELSPLLTGAVRIHLIRRFLSDQLGFMRVAKRYVEKGNFCDLIQRLIYRSGSHGKLGGRGARFFLMSQILGKEKSHRTELQDVRTPKTWYLATGSLFPFLCDNDMEHIINQKHKNLDQIRKEYPLIIQFFRSAQFPPEIVRGLDMALDDLGDVPLVVRLSSMLEDHLGGDLGRVYPARFLGNTGSRKERLEALISAIAESYASVFAAEPIAYRAEQELIDFEEDVGVLIQEVVGMQVENFYLPPLSAAVLRRTKNGKTQPVNHDVIVRLTFGFDMDRAAGDSSENALSFSLTDFPLGKSAAVRPTQTVTVLDRRTSHIVTLDFSEFMKEFGRKIVGMEKVVSEIRQGKVCAFHPSRFDLGAGNWAVTFKDFIHHISLPERIQALLDTHGQAFRSPLDLDLAHNGRDLYLLECEPLSEAVPARIGESAVPG